MRAACILALTICLASFAYGQDWLGADTSSSQAYGHISTYFTDPVFNPSPTSADRAASQSSYYPYFGEDFFMRGLNPGRASQQAIEADRLASARAYAPYFGEDFLTAGNDPYAATQPAIEARRRASAQRYAPYFGEGFLSYGEGSPFIYPGPYGVFPTFNSSLFFPTPFAFTPYSSLYYDPFLSFAFGPYKGEAPAYI